MTALPIVVAVSFFEFFEARNVAACRIVEPPDEDAPVVSMEVPDLTVREACPVCGGKGTLEIVEPNAGQWKGRLSAVNRRKTVCCSVCGGAKRIVRYVDPRELDRIVARDRTRFESEHLSRGDVPLGCAFVPRESYDSIDREKKKIVKETYGSACKACRWTGIEQCRECDGAGIVDCSHEGCRDGWVITKTTLKSSKRASGGGRGGYGMNGSGFRSSSRGYSKQEDHVDVTICPRCQGAGRMRCPSCDGRRAATCRKCHGSGVKRK